MQDDQDRPSTETEATPVPPMGQNIKALVTPGDDAEKEAEAEEVAPLGGEMPGADEAEGDRDPPELSQDNAPASQDWLVKGARDER